MPAIQPTSNAYSTALSSPSVALTSGAIMMLLRGRMADMDGQVDGLMQELENNTRRSEYIQKQSDVVAAVKQAATNSNPEPNAEFNLSDLQVTWEGETMSAAELLNRYGVDSLDANGFQPVRDPSARIAERARAIERLNSSEFDDRALALTGGLRNMDELLRGGTGRDSMPPDLQALVDDYDAAVTARSQNTRPQEYGNHMVNASAFETCLNNLKSQSRLMNSGNEVLMVQLQSTMQQRSQVLTLATQMMKSVNDGMNQIARNVG